MRKGSTRRRACPCYSRLTHVGHEHRDYGICSFSRVEKTYGLVGKRKKKKMMRARTKSSGKTPPHPSTRCAPGDRGAGGELGGGDAERSHCCCCVELTSVRLRVRKTGSGARESEFFIAFPRDGQREHREWNGLFPQPIKIAELW